MHAKRLWAIGVVVTLVLAVWLTIQQRSSRRETLRAQPAASASVQVEQTRSSSRRVPRAPVAVPRDPPPVDNIVIERVEVSKQEVCRGEDVVVTVQAVSKDKQEQYLNYGALGDPNIHGPRFSLKPRESIGYGWLRVVVQGKYGTSVLANVPPVLVKDCDAPVSASIDLQRHAAAFDRATLTARVTTPPGAQPFQPVAYEWDFGDGTSLKSEQPVVEHSYEGRAHTSAYSYFFVTVKARDAGGRVAESSRSLRFVNLGFLALANERKVRVFSGVASGGGTQGEKIRLYHGAPYAVRLERVIVKEAAVDASGAATETVLREYGALELLGFAELPPGQSLETRDLSHLRPTTAGATRILELTGRGPGGSTVTGAFSLLPPQRELALSAGATDEESDEHGP